MTQPISLTRYLVEQQREHGRFPAELRLLIEVVARACKRIAISVNKGALGEVLGTAGTENVQGEVQKKLDVISNEVLIEANEWGGHLAAMAMRQGSRAARSPPADSGARLLSLPPRVTPQPSGLKPATSTSGP